jgi:hypothetical protein
LFQAGLGVNPQSITDVALSIMTLAVTTQHWHMRQLSVFLYSSSSAEPIDKMYFDEVGLSGDEVSKYHPCHNCRALCPVQGEAWTFLLSLVMG